MSEDSLQVLIDGLYARGQTLDADAIVRLRERHAVLQENFERLLAAHSPVRERLRELLSVDVAEISDYDGEATLTMLEDVLRSKVQGIDYLGKRAEAAEARVLEMESLLSAAIIGHDSGTLPRVIGGWVEKARGAIANGALSDAEVEDGRE